MSVEFTFKVPNLAKIVRAHKDEIMLFLAANIQTNRAMLFTHSGEYNGHKKWDPLKFRDGQPLMKSGALKNSMGPSNSGNQPSIREGTLFMYTGNKITIGSNLAYARTMNDGTTKMPGGVIRPKSAQALKIPTGGKVIAGKDGKKRNFIFRKSVRIPARRFDDWTPEDAEELNIALRNKIAKVLSGG